MLKHGNWHWNVLAQYELLESPRRYADSWHLSQYNYVVAIDKCILQCRSCREGVLIFEIILVAGCTCKCSVASCIIVLYACIEACQYVRVFRLYDIWKGRQTDSFTVKIKGWSVEVGTLDIQVVLPVTVSKDKNLILIVYILPRVPLSPLLQHVIYEVLWYWLQGYKIFNARDEGVRPFF